MNRTEQRRQRLLGLAVGGVLPATIAGVAAAASRFEAIAYRGEPDGVLWLLSFVAACGVPIGAALGAVAAPAVARAQSVGDAVGLAFLVSFAAVAIGAVEVAAILVLDGPALATAADAAVLPLFVLALAVFGLAIFGLPALAIVVPISVASALIVRAIARTGSDARS